MKFKLSYFLAGLIMDGADYIIVGSLPIIGDIFDLMCMGFWYVVAKAGPAALAAGIELIPFADVLPTNIAIALYAGSRGEVAS